MPRPQPKVLPVRARGSAFLLGIPRCLQRRPPQFRARHPAEGNRPKGDNRQGSSYRHPIRGGLPYRHIVAALASSAITVTYICGDPVDPLRPISRCGKVSWPRCRRLRCWTWRARRRQRPLRDGFLGLGDPCHLGIASCRQSRHSAPVRSIASTESAATAAGLCGETTLKPSRDSTR